MRHSTKKHNKREAVRLTLIMQMSCVVCALVGDLRSRKVECHHIVRDNRRLGHWFTLPVCVGHHRGEWTDQVVRVGIASGRHAFKEAHGYDELELWQRFQVSLGMDDALPASKIVARRAA
jgi:hypothetical protein